MLHIDLVREVPEALKPRRIEIARNDTRSKPRRLRRSTPDRLNIPLPMARLRARHFHLARHPVACPDIWREARMTQKTRPDCIAHWTEMEEPDDASYKC
jgi:hypothetical protein